MTEETPRRQELLDTAVEERTPQAFRAALNELRADGLSYDKLVEIASDIVSEGNAPGFEMGVSGPAKGTWLNALTVKGRKAERLPDWRYVELLVLAYCEHHVLDEDTRDGLLVRWADGYTACGGRPRPQYRRTPESQSVNTAAARRIRQPYAIGAAMAVVLAAGSAYVLWIPASETPPLSVDDVSFLGLSTGDYVFTSTMKLSGSQVEKLKNEDYGKGKTFEDWFNENGGVPAGFRTISLTVSGRSKKELRITNIQILKRDCAPPLTGTFFLNGGTNGGESKTRTLFFNLDDRIPEPTDENSEPYFARKSITLKYGETETIVAFVSANERSCGFTFRFTVVVPGHKPVKREVSNDGKPFQLTAVAQNFEEQHPYDHYRAMYVGGVAAPVGAGIVPADPSTYNGDPQSLAAP
ncbi:hypothetical protein [Streptomyces xantholiticus]|uniref:hypothetical protein n=1 Tax=Streptomyces xantholiticus TaxID=68285 RepID=UPI00167C3530|nr:hypothetical protein [Streptomyces xantholiticus]GGW65523.1 hypothetical protein GCM10010381_58250 [Streptomyces xantholiticus]